MTFSVAVSIFLLLATFCLALSVVLLPAQRPDRIGIFATLSLGLATALMGRELFVLPDIAVLPGILAAVLLIPAVVIARAFRRIDMVAILFHRDFGMQGAGLAELKNEITTAVLTVLLICVSGLGLYGLSGRSAVGAVVVAAMLVAVNPLVRAMAGRLVAGRVDYVLSERLVRPELCSGPVATPDILILYLEGCDRRFSDRAVYGDLYDGLHRFARDGLTFTRVGQIAGTGWSLAGMSSSQSGVPITPRGLQFQTKLEDIQSFMPGVPYLGDLLAPKGYTTHYIVGGQRGFGGIEAMYTTHSVTEITDLDDMAALFPPEVFQAARAGWHMDDQLTLDAARGVHARLASEPAPFALIVETIGPHGPKGFLSRRNTASGRCETTRNIPHAARCLVEEALEFVEEIQARHRENGRDLRIVLMSDHLNHMPNLAVTDPALDGYNTVIFWGNPEHSGHEIAKPGSMIDVFPTLLDWLGWAKRPAAAGLGRSLLAEPQTLVEEFGITKLDAMIVGDAQLARLLWNEGIPSRT